MIGWRRIPIIVLSLTTLAGAYGTLWNRDQALTARRALVEAVDQSCHVLSIHFATGKPL